MPADDLSLAIRIRADAQQALDEMRKLNERLGEAGGRGREAGRSLGGLGRAALEAADAHEALRRRVEATFDATVESARAAARDQAEAGESWIEGVRAALERLRRDSDGTADETRAVTVGAFRSMEHAVARFATTGKLSFSGFVDSVISDLARPAARRTITRPLTELIAGLLPGSLGGGAAGGDVAGGDVARAGGSSAGRGAGLPRGGERAAPAERRSIGAVLGEAARASQGQMRGRRVPPAIFDGAPRFHAGGVAGPRPHGGVAGLRADEIPVIVQRGEAIFTPDQVRALGQPSVTVQIENRGTPQREVSSQVRLDPRGLVVSIVTDDLMQNGPIRQTLARTLGGGGTY